MQFRNFRKYSPNCGTFSKIHFNQKPLGLGLKRVATSSVSKRYQTSLYAQLTKTCKILHIQQSPSKITRSGVHLPKKNVLCFFAGLVNMA